LLFRGHMSEVTFARLRPSCSAYRRSIFELVSGDPSTQGDKMARSAVLACDKVSQYQGWISKGTRVFGGGQYGGFAGSIVTEAIGPR
jgi:hypothetical protein